MNKKTPSSKILLVSLVALFSLLAIFQWMNKEGRCVASEGCLNSHLPSLVRSACLGRDQCEVTIKELFPDAVRAVVLEQIGAKWRACAELPVSESARKAHSRECMYLYLFSTHGMVGFIRGYCNLDTSVPRLPANEAAAIVSTEEDGRLYFSDLSLSEPIELDLDASGVAITVKSMKAVPDAASRACMVAID